MCDSEISVVIPVHNRNHLIIRCLDSVKKQFWRPLNVIVVDNASTDSTKSTTEDWARMNSAADFSVTVCEEPQPGAARARNRGLQLTDTEYVLFFDSDDTMHPELVSEVMTSLHKDPQADIAHWRSQLIHDDSRISKRKFTDSDYWRYHIYHALLSTQCFAVRTDFFKKAGGWNVALPAWNDWELGIRLLLNNPVLLPINKTLANIYPQKESITGVDFHSKAGDWERAIDAAETAVEKSGRNDADWIADMINYRRAILAAHYKHEGYPQLAAPLLQQALHHKSITPARKLLLKILYQYTALGGRGAYLLWR